MTFQQVPDTAEVRLVYSDGTVEQESILYVSTLAVGGWDDAEIDALAAVASSSWAATLGTMTNGNFALARVEVTNLDIEFGYSKIVTNGATGTRAGSTGPYNVAAIVRHRGASGAPPRFGWTMHPALVESDIGGRSLVGTFPALLAQEYLDYQNAIEAADVNYNMVIVSRYNKAFITGDNPRGLRPVAVTNNVNSHDTNTKLGTIRGRLL